MPFLDYLVLFLMRIILIRISSFAFNVILSVNRFTCLVRQSQGCKLYAFLIKFEFTKNMQV